MTAGRPCRRYREEHLLAELERGLRPVARANILVLLWRWRYELALLAASHGDHPSDWSARLPVELRRDRGNLCDARGLARRPLLADGARPLCHHHAPRANGLRPSLDPLPARQTPDHPADQPEALRRASPHLVPRRYVPRRLRICPRHSRRRLLGPRRPHCRQRQPLPHRDPGRDPARRTRLTSSIMRQPGGRWGSPNTFRICRPVEQLVSSATVRLTVDKTAALPAELHRRGLAAR